MIGRTRRNIGAVLAAGLAVGGAVALTSSAASGVEPPEATDPVYVPFGILTIELGDRTGQLVFDPAGPGADVTQPLLNEQPCNQITLGDVSAGSGDLLSLVPLVDGVTSPADSVQQPGEFLGVQTAGENCGRQAEVIGPDELLEISLGSYFDSTVLVRSFDTVVDKKFNNDGSLTVGFDGGDQILQKTVATGGSLVSIDSTDNQGELFTSATFGSTSNRDNRGLSVGDARLELVTLSDEFEAAVDCGEKVTEIGDVGDVATKVVYLRGENETDPTKDTLCQDVGVIVEVLTEAEATGGVGDGLGGRVFWDNSFVGVDGVTPQAVQGTVTINWAPIFVEGLTQAEIEDILDRDIDYDAGGPAAPTDTLWCDSFTNESDFDLPFYDGPGANENDTAPWCLVSDERVLTNVDDPATPDVVDPKPAILQTEKLAGKGDPWRF